MPPMTSELPGPEVAETDGDLQDFEDAEPVQGKAQPGNQALSLPRWSVVALAVVIVALLVWAILATLQASDSGATASRYKALESARASALSAAQTYGVQVASYDYRHLSSDFGRVTAESTPSFQKTWNQSSQALAPVLQRFHATSSARVVAAAIQSSTTTTAVADLFVNQTVTNDSQKSPTTDQSRLQMTLLYSKGRWLIADLKLL